MQHVAARRARLALAARRGVPDRMTAVVMLGLVTALAPPARAEGAADIRAQAVQAVVDALDRVAVRNGNDYTTHFIVTAEPPAPGPPGADTGSSAKPRPAEPLIRNGFIRITAEHAPEAAMLASGPGTDWNAQVTMRVLTYCFYNRNAGAWTRPKYQMLNFLQWTVASSGGHVEVLIQPAKILPGRLGRPDEGLREYVAQLFGVEPASVTVVRPPAS